MASVARKAKQTSSNRPAEPIVHLTTVTDQMHALLVMHAKSLLDD